MKKISSGGGFVATQLGRRKKKYQHGNMEGHMQGFIYRFGIAIKEAGEKLGRITKMHSLFRPLIVAGIAIKDFALVDSGYKNK